MGDAQIARILDEFYLCYGEIPSDISGEEFAFLMGRFQWEIKQAFKHPEEVALPIMSVDEASSNWRYQAVFIKRGWLLRASQIMCCRADSYQIDVTPLLRFEDFLATGTPLEDGGKALFDTFRMITIREELAAKAANQKVVRLDNAAAGKASGDNLEIPSEYRDGGKADGKLLTVAYVSKPETYNLKGPFLSKQNLATRKHGRSLVYRFEDIARLSAAKNQADNIAH